MIRLALLVVALLAGAWNLFSADTPWWGGRPTGAAEGEPLVLGWEDLVQPGFEPPPDPFMTMSNEEIDKLFDGSPESEEKLLGYQREAELQSRTAPINDALDGRLVTLPGYVVPLDFDGQTRLSEFLLVPYFGACIHTPPPPANQIVLAELEAPVTIEDNYYPVQLRGVLRTDTVATALADTGYRMDVVSVEPYEPEAWSEP